MTKKYLDKDVKKSRIKQNLMLWETMIEKHHNIPYNPKIAKRIKESPTIRLIIQSNTPEKNEKLGYAIAKHLINSGKISPREIRIVSLEDCYLSVRGFGENGSIKKQIFDNTNKLIIIENVREERKTDVLENVFSFWKEFINYCKINQKLSVILCLETNIDDKVWTKQSVFKNGSLNSLGFLKY